MQSVNICLMDEWLKWYTIKIETDAVRQIKMDVFIIWQWKGEVRLRKQISGELEKRTLYHSNFLWKPEIQLDNSSSISSVSLTFQCFASRWPTFPSKLILTLCKCLCAQISIRFFTFPIPELCLTTSLCLILTIFWNDSS